MNASVPSSYEQFAVHLRTLGASGLTQLLSEWSDAVAEPQPHTLEERATIPRADLCLVSAVPDQAS